MKTPSVVGCMTSVMAVSAKVIGASMTSPVGAATGWTEKAGPGGKDTAVRAPINLDRDMSAGGAVNTTARAAHMKGRITAIRAMAASTKRNAVTMSRGITAPTPNP